MQGCPEPAPQSTGWGLSSVRDAAELKAIVAAVGTNLERPLAAIRDAVEPLLAGLDPKAPAAPHLGTALAMCDDVSRLTRRYLDFIEQAEAIPLPEPGPVRPDELLAEIDSRLMPDAFGLGVAWSCSIDGPIRPILTDRGLVLEALLEWASLAISSARPGDGVSLVVATDSDPALHQGDGDVVLLTLESSADELIADLTSLRDDPLFNRAVCLGEVGSDPGSRLALSLERLRLLGIAIRAESGPNGLIRAVRFRVPAAPPRSCSA
ncbi:ATP-binding protein [Tautonia sociabilis]|uniref:Uncharacterized protein n=1 Tax=Tautonia sociabilis TaxID=2080755 RepID=A0A432MM09_9BACT|nr:hypothetical protein [Tautonia sociabilis]RUL88451.1 hypothetical protein TsocGM_06980 [Tautonia sociabilis]